MPPSDRATRRFGNLRNTGDHTRSAAHCTMFIGCSVIIASIGASMAVIVICDDEPMCRQMTVPTSSQAWRNGSQWSLCQLGQAELLGVLGEGDGVAALLGHAAHLGGHELDVPDRRDGQRDHPARVGAAPLVDVPVVVGPQQLDGDVLVLAGGEQLAA